MNTNPASQSPRVVFRAPVIEPNGSRAPHIDINQNGVQDAFCFSFTGSSYGEPSLPQGTVDAILERGERVTKEDLGTFKVDLVKNREFVKTKSLDWVAKKASPVKGGQWALEPTGNGGMDFLITK